MYKVLLVDDDTLVRLDLRMLIPWEEYGFQIIGEAINGKKALAFMIEKKPDIVITDIGMPEMDGLTLIREINQKKLDIRIVVLSCHDDFHNVKTALQLGALDYILKHELDEQYLRKVILHVKEQIRVEIKQKEQSIKLQHENYVKQLIYKSSAFTALKFSCLAVLVVRCAECIHLHHKEHSVEMLQEVMDGIVKDSIESHEHIFVCGEKEHITVIFYIQSLMDQSAFKERIEFILRRLQMRVDKYLQTQIHVGISAIVVGGYSLYQAYHEALQALHQGVYEPHAFLFWYKKPVINSTLAERLCSLEKNFIHGAEDHDFHQIESCIGEYYKVFYEHKVEQSVMVAVKMQWLQWVQYFIQSFHIVEEDIFGGIHLSIEQVLKNHYIEEEKKYILSIFQKLAAVIEDVHIRPEIKKAIHYIKQNYMHPITQGEVAEHVGLNSAYFSSVFKKEMQKPFTTYLNEVRIQKAKDLLRWTPMSAQQISEQIGYQHYSYFFKIFKEITGLTVSEYKKTI